MAKRKDIIQGVHGIEEAIGSGHPLRRVIIQQGNKNPKIKEVIARLKEQEIPLQVVPRERINQFGQHHQGIVAFSSPIEFTPLENLLPGLFEQGKTPLLLMLDQITDVRNFGAISRSAAFLGADALIIPQKGSADINEDAVKTSSGALLKLPVCRVKSLVNTVKFMQDSGVSVVSATEKASKNLNETDLKTPICLIMGSEEKGINEDLLRLSDHQACIPGMGDLDSLNVSVATGICLYEIQRQRNQSHLD